MRKVRDLAYHKKLEPLLAGQPSEPGRRSSDSMHQKQLARGPPQPATCPAGHGAHSGHACCPAFCIFCTKWHCGLGAWFCSTCGTRLMSSLQARWSLRDSPKLHPSLRELRRDTLEDMLASLVVVTGGDYRNT